MAHQKSSYARPKLT